MRHVVCDWRHWRHALLDPVWWRAGVDTHHNITVVAIWLVLAGVEQAGNIASVSWPPCHHIAWVAHTSAHTAHHCQPRGAGHRGQAIHCTQHGEIFHRTKTFDQVVQM